jgi:hypothetical protein
MKDMRGLIYNARAYQCGEEQKTATNLATAPNTPRPNSSAGSTEQVKDLNATTELLLLARRQDSASVRPSELQNLLRPSAHNVKKQRKIEKSQKKSPQIRLQIRKHSTATQKKYLSAHKCEKNGSECEGCLLRIGESRRIRKKHNTTESRYYTTEAGGRELRENTRKTE